MNFKLLKWFVISQCQQIENWKEGLEEFKIKLSIENYDCYLNDNVNSSIYQKISPHFHFQFHHTALLRLFLLKEFLKS